MIKIILSIVILGWYFIEFKYMNIIGSLLYFAIEHKFKAISKYMGPIAIAIAIIWVKEFLFVAFILLLIRYNTKTSELRPIVINGNHYPTQTQIEYYTNQYNNNNKFE